MTTELVDDGEKRDSRGRRVTPLRRRKELLEEYAASGLTMAGFARREGVKYATFANWVVRAQRETAKAAPVRFAEVRLPWAAEGNAAAGDRLEVRLPDGTVSRGHVMNRDNAGVSRGERCVGDRVVGVRIEISLP